MQPLEGNPELTQSTQGFECAYKEHYLALPDIRDAVVQAVCSRLEEIRQGDEVCLGTVTGVFKYPTENFGHPPYSYLSVNDDVIASLLAEGVAIVAVGNHEGATHILGDHRLQDALKNSGMKPPASITDTIAIREDIQPVWGDAFSRSNVRVMAKRFPLRPDQRRGLNAMLSQHPLTRKIEEIRRLVKEIFRRRSPVKLEEPTAKRPSLDLPPLNLDEYLEDRSPKFTFDLSGKQNMMNDEDLNG